MGNNPNEIINQPQKTYYQQQVQIFRWRANPNVNSFIPRVYFRKRQQQLQKQKFNNLLFKQLNGQILLDVEEINKLILNDKNKFKNGQIIVFQQFCGQLSFLEKQLQLQQCLYVLNGLLEAHQKIFSKFGKTLIQNKFCFFNQNGQIRGWINDNPSKNQFYENMIAPFFSEIISEKQQKKILTTVAYSSEARIIKRIVEINQSLSNGSKKYQQFICKIHDFMNKNILHHTNFSSIRKFINKYLFDQKILLPYNLLNVFKRIKDFHKLNQDKQKNRHSSESINETNAYLSTNANLEGIKNNNSEQTPKNFYQSHTFQTDKKPKQVSFFYEKNRNIKSSKQQKPHILQSTLMCSQLTPSRQHLKQNLSKNFDFQTKRKEGYSKKYSEYHQSSYNFFKKSIKEVNNSKSAKVSVKFHSRQPSLEQETSSMMISPANEKVDYGIHYSYAAPSNNKFHNQKVLESIQLQSGQKRMTNSNKQSLDDKINSQFLTRQVSCLVSNNSLSICESLGTFQSIDNSKDSGYKGILSKMGKTAKIVNITTGRRLGGNRGKFQGAPYMTS